MQVQLNLYSLEYNVVLISSHLFVFLLSNMEIVITTCYLVEKMKLLARQAIKQFLQFSNSSLNCPKLDKIWPIYVDFSKFVNLFS